MTIVIAASIGILILATFAVIASCNGLRMAKRMERMEIKMRLLEHRMQKMEERAKAGGTGNKALAFYLENV